MWTPATVGDAVYGLGFSLGRALLQPVTARAAARDQPCYLETAQPQNIAFYEHLGFRVLADIVDPASGLRMWTFRRDPPAR
jgi:ribosomal protein S18 acetylase RimI-like enzyme